MKFDPYEIVQCIRGSPGAGLKEGSEYTIAVCVVRGYDYHGERLEGYILHPENGVTYPYVWDENRFVSTGRRREGYLK